MLFVIRRLFLPLFLLTLPFSLFGRGSGDIPEERGNGDSTSAFIEITDHYGRSVNLDEPAQRIVSLAPGITETVFALGYGNRLVGRTAYCDYPPRAASIPDMGNLMEPDLESILAADPDIVLASTHFSMQSLRRLEAAGLDIAILMGQDSFDGVYDGVIRPTASILGDPEAGELLISSMKGVIAEAREKAAAFDTRPSVYYVVGFGEGGDWTAGADTFIGEMIGIAGGRNIADDVKGWSFSAEALVERDPDVIILPGWAGSVFGTATPYSELRAVKAGRAIPLDENAIVRQGPRLAEGFASLVDAIGSAL